MGDILVCFTIWNISHEEIMCMNKSGAEKDSLMKVLLHCQVLNPYYWAMSV